MKKINNDLISLKFFLVLLLFSLNFFFVVACTKNNNNEKATIWQIEEEEEIIFPLDHDKNGVPLNYYPYFNCLFDYLEIDGIETLIIPIKDTNYRIAFYDVKNHKEYHSINLKKNRDISNFTFVNKDTIIVFYKPFLFNGVYEPLYFEMFNYKGESKICDYSIDTTNFTKENIEERMPIPIIPNDKIIVSDGKIYFQTQTDAINTIGFKNNDHINTPLFAYYDFKTKKIIFPKSIVFPNEVIGQYYNTYFKKIHCCLSKNKTPIIRFFYSSTIYSCDKQCESIKRYNLKSKILDTIPALKSEKSSPKSLNAVYGDIIFDNENNLYYSFVYYNNIIYENNYSSLIISDTNFNYLGEILNPPMGANLAFFKKKIILYYYKNDSIHIIYNKIKNTQKPIKPYLDSVKKILKGELHRTDIDNFLLHDNPVVSYLNKSTNKKSSDRVILILYANEVCPNCEKIILETINDNYKSFINQNFYLIYSGTKNEIRNIRTFENISKINLIIDSTNTLKKIALKEDKEISMEPRLIVVKNNKILLDYNYSWKEVKTKLIDEIIKNL